MVYKQKAWGKLQIACGIKKGYPMLQFQDCSPYPKYCRETTMQEGNLTQPFSDSNGKQKKPSLHTCFLGYPFDFVRDIVERSHHSMTTFS